ncbi:MAG: TolB family protein [Terriglobales bacterium]
MALAAAAGFLLRPATPKNQPVRFSIPVPSGGSHGYGLALSPDGRWVAYESNAAGGSDTDIFVADFPHHAGQWQISYHGGYWPIWSGDGSQIYFISGGHLMTVAVKPGATPQLSPPQALFPVNPPSDATESSPDYALLAGGREFLLDQVTGAKPVAINVVTHWTAALPH